MDITLMSVTIRELVEGFKNSEEEGVVGFGGMLNIRPPYQREFVYTKIQEIEVINSIFKDFPLNVMYWVSNKEGGYELLDGQQRTLSICSFYKGGFFIILNGNTKGYKNLSVEQKEQFLNYKLQIYVCENGTYQEQLDWFRIINIAGERLTNQEMRNAVYNGPWVTQAKKLFSKNSCPAEAMARQYMSGKPIRQDYLETVLDWLSGGKIDEYMAEHQYDKDAEIEWQYFQSVINWVKILFPKYRDKMKGVEWGKLYNRFKDNNYKASDLELEVTRLMKDSDVTDKKGIYDYVLSGDERKLNIRAFDDNMKAEAYERQEGKCAICGGGFLQKQMEADHITPWCEGGKTVAENCQMLCRACNRHKSSH